MEDLDLLTEVELYPGQIAYYENKKKVFCVDCLKKSKVVNDFKYSVTKEILESLIVPDLKCTSCNKLIYKQKDDW